jgi:hypothetical protein
MPVRSGGGSGNRDDIPEKAGTTFFDTAEDRWCWRTSTVESYMVRVKG